MKIQKTDPKRDATENDAVKHVDKTGEQLKYIDKRSI